MTPDGRSQTRPSVQPAVMNNTGSQRHEKAEYSVELAVCRHVTPAFLIIEAQL